MKLLVGSEAKRIKNELSQLEKNVYFESKWRHGVSELESF